MLVRFHRLASRIVRIARNRSGHPLACAALVCCGAPFAAQAMGGQDGAYRAPVSVDGPSADVRRPRAPAGASPQDISTRLAAADCKTLHLDAASLTALQQLLQPLGLALRVLGCPHAPAPLNQRVLAVTAVVLDGGKATDTVRGALGDGEPVDMGGSYKPEAWHARSDRGSAEVWDDSAVSPDVQFNRRWLRNAMASQGYASVTGPWWAFIPVHKRKR